MVKSATITNTKLTAPKLVAKTKSPQATSAYDANPSSIAVGLMVGMAWQLAIVVLVPIFGGHEIDIHMNNRVPGWTLAGLLFAMLLMIVVIRRTLKQLNEFMKLPSDKTEENV